MARHAAGTDLAASLRTMTDGVSSRTHIRLVVLSRTCVGILDPWSSRSTPNSTRSPGTSTPNTAVSFASLRDLLDAPDAWTGPGIWNLEQFLCWRTGVGLSQARQVRAVAERRHELPDCIAAIDRGELSLDQLTAIAKKVPAWADHEVALLAPKLTVRQLQRLLGKYQFPDLAAGDGRPEVGPDAAESSTIQSDEPELGPPVPSEHRAPTRHTPIDAGGCRMFFDDDGRFHLTVTTDTVTGKIIEQAVNEARDQLFCNGQQDVTTLDGLREVAQRSLDGIASPDRRNRWRLNIHLRTDGRCTDDTGHFLPDAIRRYVTCDGALTPTFSANGVAVSVGRTQYIVPDRTRRLVIERDGGCDVPGCGSTHHLEVHHIVHWGDDGPTDTWNLVTLCPHHHRMHHQGRLGIAGNADVPDGVVYTDADGNVITASGARPRPPGAAPPPIAGQYRHPLGERMDMHWVVFNPPAHYGRKRVDAMRYRSTHIAKP